MFVYTFIVLQGYFEEMTDNNEADFILVLSKRGVRYEQAAFKFTDYEETRVSMHLFGRCPVEVPVRGAH